jgi:hypothetical protein
METYPHLVSSQIPHIFIIYFNIKFVQIPHISIYTVNIGYFIKAICQHRHSSQKDLYSKTILLRLIAGNIANE